MSIAVSAVIRTPIGLRLLQACLGSCALLAAWPLSGIDVCVRGVVGGYALGWPAAVLSACGGLFLLALSCRCAKRQTLDISPVGQLRLAVYLEHGAGLEQGRVVVVQRVQQRVQQQVQQRVQQRRQQAGQQSQRTEQPGQQAQQDQLSVPVSLLPASTLWPGWLLLRLADGEGRVSTVLVQRGTRSCAAFRGLAVACRAIAARGREK